MKAYRIFEDSKGLGRGRVVDMDLDELSPGEVLIRVEYSGINYKDALAGMGKGKILRRYPFNGGIDAAGVIEESRSPDWKVGESVLINGCGLSETQDGGYAEYLRVPAASVIALPKGLSTREAMLLGTAGFTAALALHRMEVNGQRPGLGPILVTGASGGVGSVALQIFSHTGYQCIAVSGKAELEGWLRSLGASEVISPDELNLGTRPLESVRFGGVVDNVGGELLSRSLAHVELWGNVAAIGLAASPVIDATVMPFILRGVSLLGTSSNNCTMDLRREIWQRLGQEWKPRDLEKIFQAEVELTQLDEAFNSLLQRRNHGRILVRIP